MADSQSYTVREADYLDQEDGLLIGVGVVAEPGEITGQLRVTQIGDEILKSPIAVYEHQLQLAAV
ncbi:hypothetical protein [Arthrobacter sp. H14]|uniref:hypothetical protein n=1 Tax=Arthrobacter sp. H14 TaxID=1312959 RepID=UPI00047B2E21|nr:hypothetical protein [Arthrobacter sp. H14]